MASWSKPGVCAFASESGFVGLTTDEHKRASLTVVPFGENFGPDAGRMVKLLLKTMSLQVVRASCDNTGADALLESMGLRYDGCIRRWAAHQNGNGTQFLDVTFWSMIPEEAEIGH